MSLSTLRPVPVLRRLGARLALFALLVSALVPTFSRLAQPVGYDASSALCQSAVDDGSANGGRSVRTAGHENSDSPPKPHDEHVGGDACVLCTLAHHLPSLAGRVHPVVAVLAYAPPLPGAVAAVRAHAVQSRAPGARAPPAVG